MTKPAIYLEKDGSIGWLVLNQPAKRNALSKAMWDAIPGLLADALADGAIRSVVIRGVDAAAFAAGADISEFESTHADPAKSKAYNRAVHAASRRLMRFEKPVIAMIQGPCVGGGCASSYPRGLGFESETRRALAHQTARMTTILACCGAIPRRRT